MAAGWPSSAPGRVDSHGDVGVRVLRPFPHEAVRDQAFRPPRLLDDPAVLPRIVAGPRHRLAYGLLARILVRAIDRLDRRKEVCQPRRVILRPHGTHGDIRLARSVGHSSTPPHNTCMPSGAYPQCNTRIHQLIGGAHIIWPRLLRPLAAQLGKLGA